MRTPLLIVLFALGFIAVSAASCGGKAPCNQTSCPSGCCNSNGLCESGSSGSACGSRGSACQACGVTASCVAGTCMTMGIGTGGGTSGTGGGSSGGGSAGGGSAGGGSAGGGSAGGGSSAGGSSGGGSSAGGSSAGGSSGGGSSGGGSTAGGSAAGGSAAGGSSGGGTAGGAAALCTRIGAAVNRFFAGNSGCGSMGLTVSNAFSLNGCLSAYPSCTAFDLQTINAGLPCLEQTTPCTAGNETAALQSFGPCAATLSDISPGCQAAIGLE